MFALYLAFFQEFFQGAKSIVMQISFVMLIFLLFSDQISGGQKSLRGQTASGGHPLPPFGRKPVYQIVKWSVVETDPLQEQELCCVAGITSFESGAM